MQRNFSALWKYALGLALLVPLSVPANAQIADMGHCTDDANVPADEIVSACIGFISRSFQQNWDLGYVPRAMVYQATAYERLGKDDEAVTVLKAAIKRYPQYPRAWEQLGELLEKQKGPGLLMETMDLMIRTNPGNAAVLNYACWVRAKKGEQLDAAMADCNEALRLNPGDANTLDSRAFAWFRNGKFAEAIADASSALAKDPKIASSLYVRGLAKSKSGDAAGGQTDIAAAKSINAKIADTFATYGVTP